MPCRCQTWKTHGISPRQFPDDLLQELNTIAQEEIDKLANLSPVAAEIHASYREFEQSIRAYQDVSEEAYVRARNLESLALFAYPALSLAGSHVANSGHMVSIPSTISWIKIKGITPLYICVVLIESGATLLNRKVKIRTGVSGMKSAGLRPASRPARPDPIPLLKAPAQR